MRSNVELSVGLIAVAFAIRTSSEQVAYSLLCDLAIMCPALRSLFYDLAKLPKEDPIAHLNPTSSILVRGIAELENEVLQVDKEALKRQMKLYRINEDNRAMYKQLQFGRNIYEQTKETIRFFKDMYKKDWKNELPNIEKEICSLVEAGFEYVTEFQGAKIFRKRKL